MKNTATHSDISEKAPVSCFSSFFWPDTWNCQTVCPNFSFQKYSRLTRISGAQVLQESRGGSWKVNGVLP